jgi:hypothetical protein
VVELVEGPVCEHDVPLRVDVRADAEEHLAVVVDVDALVDDDDGLRERQQAESPDRVHHLPRVTREALADRDDHAVVEGARRRQVVVDDLGHAHANRREEDPLRRLREPLVLGRRLADDDRRIDRVPAHRDRGDAEERELLGRRVVAGVIAERPLHAAVRRVDPPLEDDLGVRGNLEVDGLAPHELHRRTPEKACDHQLADVLRQRGARGVRGDGIEAERDGDRDAAVRRSQEVGTSVLVHLPVHEGGATVDLLHPVHADVPHTRRAVLRDHGRKGDERRRVERPAAHDRERVEVDGLALEDDLLACAFRDRLRRRIRDRLERAELAHLVDQTLRRRQLEHLLEPRRDVVEALDPEREAHAPLGAELVDQQR